MKLLDGIYQTATQVKVLSPEIINVEEADSFHVLEGCMNGTAIARYNSFLRGLSPWYDIEWKLSEPGRPELLPAYRISGDNLKRREFRDGNSGVGLTHSRGVAGVMPCESGVSRKEAGHSKGLASICKGEGIRSPATELGALCKQN
jgi:hypothetical protein